MVSQRLAGLGKSSVHLIAKPISPRQLHLEFINQCKCGPVKPWLESLLGALNSTLQFWPKTHRSLFFILFHSGISITHLLLSRISPTYRLGKLVYSHFLLFSILLDTKTPFPHTESLYSSGSPKKCFSVISTPFPGFLHSSGYDKWVFTLLNTSSIQHLNASLL